MWSWEGCGCVRYSAVVRYSTVIWSTKEVTRPVGFDLQKKTKDLSVRESEECGYGEGVGVYVTLLESDTVQSHGHVKEGS